MPHGKVDRVSLLSLVREAGTQGLPTHMWSPFKALCTRLDPGEGEAGQWRSLCDLRNGLGSQEVNNLATESGLPFPTPAASTVTSDS